MASGWVAGAAMGSAMGSAMGAACGVGCRDLARSMRAGAPSVATSRAAAFASRKRAVSVQVSRWPLASISVTRHFTGPSSPNSLELITSYLVPSGKSHVYDPGPWLAQVGVRRSFSSKPSSGGAASGGGSTTGSASSSGASWASGSAALGAGA